MVHRKPKKFLISVQTLLISASAVLVLLIGGAILAIGYKGSNDALTAALEEQFETLGVMMRERARRLVEPVQSQLAILSYDQVTVASDLSTRLTRLPVLAAVLDSNSTSRNLYIGYPNGEFLLMRKIDSEELRARLELNETTAYLVQTLTLDNDGDMIGEYRFYDADLHLQDVQLRPDYVYDPSERPWYQASANTDAPVTSAPYAFFTTGEIGITVSQRSASAASVVGLDATLDQLANEVQNLRLTPGTEVAIAEEDGTLIAYPDLFQVVQSTPDGEVDRQHIGSLASPVLGAVAEKLGLSGGNRRGKMMANGRQWIVSSRPMDLGMGNNVRLLFAVPTDQLFSATRAIIRDQGLVVLLLLLLSIVITLLIIRQITRPLRQLSEDVQGLAAFEFASPVKVDSRVREASELAETIDRLRLTISRFMYINRVIAAEKDFNTLLVKILDEIVATTETQAGILYLTDNAGNTLLPFASRCAHGRSLEREFSALPLSSEGGLPVRAAMQERSLSAKASVEELTLMGLMKLPDLLNEAPTDLLATPLYSRSNELVGVILLIEDGPLDPALVRFTEALSGSAAVSLEARRLIAAQQELFESFIQLIAGAIDAKSPYTGGHCARVPELTKLLAQAACEATDGPYKDFSLSRDEWESIHVAAWLHDCGKITTPEFVVDKATKLETIYDRIHEIRMRVEVMKREAEILRLRETLTESGIKFDEAELNKELAELNDDFAFIAQLNQGGEFLDEHKLERMQRMAKKHWTRTLDDRLGVSQAELDRKNCAPAPVLPVEEPLLADKPEHLFPRLEAEQLPADNRWGFKMAVPELLYHQGELHNLAIHRGTLTDEDRYKINEHIIQTIKMLENLPFPKHLQNVPEFAGGHHEKMDGTGYPRGLTKDEMSPVARMMAVADIFEALTAADRPYKKGKTLSEAIKILSFMVKDQHIDPDVFKLFLESGMYKIYADRYMRPEQIDEVDIDDYLP